MTAEQPPSKTVSAEGLTFRTQGNDAVIVAENSKVARASITIPATVPVDGKPVNVTSVGPAAFHLNDTVTQILFAPGTAVVAFEEKAFQNCEKLVELQIPPTLTRIHSATFRHTPALVTVTAAGNTEYVIKGGILYSKDETKILFCPRNRAGPIEIASSVTSIGEYAFENCVGVTDIQFPTPSAVVAIGDGAFAGTSITRFRLPASVTSFSGQSGASAGRVGKFPRDGFLQDCEKLTNVEIESGTSITEIPPSAFSNSGIVEFVVPKSVKKLSVQCFAKTNDLKRVSFEPGSVCTTIESDAFLATGLETLNLPASLEVIAPGQFLASENLVTIDIPAGNDKYIFRDGLLLSGDQKQVLFGLRSLSEVTIPEPVELIAANAFCNCRQLKRVIFQGTNVTVIEGYAFYDTAIQVFDVPDSVKRIGENAFGSCVSLALVGFGPASQLTEIGSRAFGLTSLTIFEAPPELRRVGTAAFANSTLRQVRFREKVDTVEKLLFFGCASLKDLVLLNPGTVTIQPLAFEEAGKLKIHKAASTKLAGPELATIPVDTNTEVVFVQEERYEKPAGPGKTLADLVVDGGERERTEGPRGEGSFGTVYRARHRRTGEISAVKELKKSESVTTAFVREAEMLARLAHPAILGCIGFVFPTGDQAAQIVTEWLPNGSLEDIIAQPERYKQVSNTEKVKMIVGIALAMRYFHKTGGMHRDLKPANILLDEKNEIRVADFGSARFSNVQATLTGAVGTPWYMAPEVGEGADYNQSVDLFSFAIIVWELITGKTMMAQFGKEFQGPLAWLGKVKNQKTRPPTTGLSEPVVDLLNGCWDSRPDVRFTFDAVLEGLRSGNYKLLDGVDSAAVKEYVARIEDYEEQYPAEPIDV